MRVRECIRRDLRSERCRCRLEASSRPHQDGGAVVHRAGGQGPLWLFAKRGCRRTRRRVCVARRYARVVRSDLVAATRNGRARSDGALTRSASPRGGIASCTRHESSARDRTQPWSGRVRGTSWRLVMNAHTRARNVRCLTNRNGRQHRPRCSSLVDLRPQQMLSASSPCATTRDKLADRGGECDDPRRETHQAAPVRSDDRRQGECSR